MELNLNERPLEPFADYMLQTVPGLNYFEKNGVAFWQSPLLKNTGLLRHAFSTRRGGISQGTFASMNLSVTRTAGFSESKRNYEIALGALGIDIDNTVLVDGVHGINVKHVGAQNRGDGLMRPYGKGGDFFDGMITDTSSVALVTIHADCTPLFIVDPVHVAIGLCHAGWRGTVDGMGVEIIHAMQRTFSSKPEDLVCMIGPHIGACCFEVDEDVALRFDKAFPGFGGIQKAEAPGKYFVDLTLAMAFQLYSMGVLAHRVNIAHLCTCCNETMFHSFRRDGKDCGAMASFMQLEPINSHRA